MNRGRIAEIARRVAFNEKFDFSKVKEVTLKEVFGGRKIKPSTATKKLWDYAKKKKILEKGGKKKGKRGRKRTAEHEMICRSFVPARDGVSEEDVRTLVAHLGDGTNDADMDLVEAAQRRPGVVYVVGGDKRVGEPPYIFRGNADGTFEDNIVD